MSNYPIYNETEIETYLLNEVFVKKTIKQIQKNLNQFGYDFTPSETLDNPLENIILTLIPIIENFIKSDSEKFMAYLYVVDLNESKLSLNEYGENYNENISYKIIKREAQKVFFQFITSGRKI